jgi:hypothetical protein
MKLEGSLKCSQKSTQVPILSFFVKAILICYCFSQTPELCYTFKVFIILCFCWILVTRHTDVLRFILFMICLWTWWQNYIYVTDELVKLPRIHVICEWMGRSIMQRPTRDKFTDWYKTYSDSRLCSFSQALHMLCVTLSTFIADNFVL